VRKIKNQQQQKQKKQQKFFNSLSFHDTSDRFFFLHALKGKSG